MRPASGFPNCGRNGESCLTIKNPGLKGKTFSQPVVTAALTHALSIAGYMFLDPSDEVIIPDLYWDNYELVFTEAYGAKLSFYNTFVNGGFDVAAFSKALNSGKVGKKFVLLEFPEQSHRLYTHEAEAKALTTEIRKAAEAGNRLWWCSMTRTSDLSTKRALHRNLSLARWWICIPTSWE